MAGVPPKGAGAVPCTTLTTSRTVVVAPPPSTDTATTSTTRTQHSLARDSLVRTGEEEVRLQATRLSQAGKGVMHCHCSSSPTPQATNHNPTLNRHTTTSNTNPTPNSRAATLLTISSPTRALGTGMHRCGRQVLCRLQGVPVTRPTVRSSGLATGAAGAVTPTDPTVPCSMTQALDTGVTTMTRMG